MNRLLDIAKQRAESAEVYRLKQRVVPVHFAPNGISGVEVRRTEGVALRVVADGRIGYVASTDLAHPEEIADAAVAAAEFGPEASFEFPDVPAKPLDGLSVPETAALPIERLVAFGEEVRRCLVNARPDAEPSVGVDLEVEEISVHNTRGMETSEQSAQIKVSAGLRQTRSGDILSVFRDFQARTIGELSAEACASQVLDQMALAADIVVAPSGEMPLVFTPNAAIALVLPLMFGLNGELASTGMSPLPAKVGELLFDPAFSVFDDGRNITGSIPGAFDPEGTPTQRTTLVDRGVLQGFFHDRRSAQRMGAEPTGNGYKGGLMSVFEPRGYRSQPGAIFSHFEVGDGGASQQELIREVKNGLLIDDVLGLGQGNLLAGEFSNNVGIGYRIENGRITGRVKDVMISGNSYDLLKDHLIGLGDDPGWFAGRVLAPSIAVRGVSVASK